jgi:meso-butanediol dehydrogenase / (S,S)-butanediol dehydrogenase / diacetyl reductase
VTLTTLSIFGNTLWMSTTALVTGGSSGIGKATAKFLLDKGWNVMICGRDPERLESAGAELGSTGDRLATAVADLASADDARMVVARTVEAFERLDGLVNAHGVPGKHILVEDLSEADWDDVLRINLMGPIWTTTAAIPHLRRTHGSVVQVSSIYSRTSEPATAPYGVSKAGLDGFTRYAALELAASGVRVNAVLPGWVETPMGQPLFEELGLSPDAVTCNPFGRLAQPEEIATVIAFLLSRDASFITGESLVVDGGQLLKTPELAAAATD